ncbi:MAG: hypothetical protein L6V81_10265 [Clostridium sp.]|nr:MAG: hypothetical protein L6V81_10265 [Clostridium sp.]
MIGPVIHNVLKSPILTDSENNIMICLIVSIVILASGFITIIIYNLNYKFRDYKYSLPIILSLFF